MRIAILGAGSLGSALGQQLHRRGHEIMYGGLATAHETAARVGALAGSSRAAVMFGELVILAVPFQAVDTALHEAGPLAGRILWCCVNAFNRELTGLAVGFSTSAAEEVARRAPGARVVAAIPPSAAAIASGDLSYETCLAPSVFLCGDDTASKDVVGRLVRELGADPVDAGPLSVARVVEPAMMLMASIAYASVPRDVALRLLERDLD